MNATCHPSPTIVMHTKHKVQSLCLISYVVAWQKIVLAEMLILAAWSGGTTWGLWVIRSSGY